MTLRYATNGPQFDFPPYLDYPPKRYIISSSPRSGSNLLQRALWKTGIAGAPEEYLSTNYVNDFAQRWPEIRNEAEIDVKEFVRKLYCHRTSPNGVFGLKLHGEHLTKPLLSQYNLQILFQDPSHIWVRRRHRVRQAISWTLAVQTGIWIIDGEWLPDSNKSDVLPVYDFDNITTFVNKIVVDEELWMTYFLHQEIQPLTVFYEDLCEHYSETIEECLTYLKIPPPHPIAPPGIKRQSTSLNDDWEARYIAELGRRGVTVPYIERTNRL